MDQCCSKCCWLTGHGAVWSDTWVGPCIVDMASLTQTGCFEGVLITENIRHWPLQAEAVKPHITLL